MSPTAAASNREAPLSLPPTRTWTLSNGLTVVVAERRGLPLVAVRLEVAAGSAHEGESKAGLAEFTAHLLRRGTKRRNADQIDATVESVGGSLGVDVDPDSIGLSVSLPSEHLGAALDVLADLALNPRFPLTEVHAARGRTLAALSSDLDDPSTVADKALSHFALGSHPYAHPVGGWSRTVKTFTTRDVSAFHARTFTPERAALYIVGDVSGAKLEALVKRHFARWERGGDADTVPEVPPVPGPESRRVIIVDKPDATQTQLRIAGQGIPRNSADYFPCVVAAGVLGGGFTSRLMDEIRVNRGLSYGVSSRFFSYRHGGEFVISTFTKTETTVEAIQVALDVTRGLAESGPRDEELARTQTYLRGLFPLQLETNEQIARMLADLRLYGIGDDYVERFRDRVAAVTAGATQAAGKTYFPLDRYTLIAVGRARSIAKALAPFGKVQVKKLAELE